MAECGDQSLNSSIVRPEINHVSGLLMLWKDTAACPSMHVHMHYWLWKNGIAAWILFSSHRIWIEYYLLKQNFKCICHLIQSIFKQEMCTFLSLERWNLHRTLKLDEAEWGQFLFSILIDLLYDVHWCYIEIVTEIFSRVIEKFFFVVWLPWWEKPTFPRKCFNDRTYQSKDSTKVNLMDQWVLDRFIGVWRKSISQE